MINKLIKQYLFFLCNAVSYDGSRSPSLLGLDIGLSDPEFLMTLIRFSECRIPILWNIKQRYETYSNLFEQHARQRYLAVWLPI